MRKLRLLIGANERIYLLCSITDQKYIDMLALVNPVAALLVGLAFYSFVLFFSGSMIVAFPIGVICFMLALWQGQSLLNSESIRQIYARLFASILIALFITIPFKTNEMHDSLVVKIEQEVAAKNADVLLEMNDKIETIEEEGRVLNQKMVEASENRVFDKQPFYDARRALNSFNQTKQKRIDDTKAAYQGKIKQPEITKFDVMGYYVKVMFSKENPGELFINLAIMVFLLLIEALPAFLRLALEGGSYMEERDHYFAMKKAVNNTKKGMERKIVDNDDDMVNDLMQIEIINEKSKQVDNGFNDPKKLVELAHMAKIIESQKKPSTPDVKQTGQDDLGKNGETLEDIPHEFFG